jgi:hypothetical protein
MSAPGNCKLRRRHPDLDIREVRYQALPGSLRNSITVALAEAAMISQEPGIPCTSRKLS